MLSIPLPQWAVCSWQWAGAKAPLPAYCLLNRRARGRLAVTSIELSEHVAQLFVVRRFSDVMDVDVADDALLVDDHDGALADAFVFFPDAVFLRDFALGMEIGEERVLRDPADRF